MGCSTSTETEAREGSRPGTKPEETNGVAVEYHCDNTGISEDTETIPDSNNLNEEPPASETIEGDAEVVEVGPHTEGDDGVGTRAVDQAQSTEEQPSQEAQSSEVQDAGENGEVAPEHTTDTVVTEPQAEPTSPQEAPASPENE